MINENAYERKDLIVMHNTGRDSTTGYGKDKTHHYFSGYMTPSGEIEQSEWRRLAEALVAREGGDDELKEIIAGVESHCAWLRNDTERRDYALQLYMHGAKSQR
jgi:hypothetical protein